MLKNKTILITGGTGTLGEACVRRFLQEHARVFFTYYSNHEKAHLLERAGASALQCDLSSSSEIISLASCLRAKLPALDILINNAAVVRDHTITNLSEQDWDYVIAVNIKAVLTLSYSMYSLLKNSVSKKIFNVVSRVGSMGGFGQANYAAAKDALIELTKCLALEWGGEGIAVNGINPGFMDSTITRGIPDAIRTMQRKNSMLRTYSDPYEVADFILYLSCDHCSRISGQILHYETRVNY